MHRRELLARVVISRALLGTQEQAGATPLWDSGAAYNDITLPDGPNPLSLQIRGGDENVRAIVLQFSEYPREALSLSKINWNSTQFSTGDSH